jgi:hypothetical protein
MTQRRLPVLAVLVATLMWGAAPARVQASDLTKKP